MRRLGHASVDLTLGPSGEFEGRIGPLGPSPMPLLAALRRLSALTTCYFLISFALPT